MDWIKKDWKFIYNMHLKVYIGLLCVCELRFIRQCFWYFRLISWYHEEGQKTTNRTKNLWRFLRAATPCLRTCISAQVILSRKFHKVESNKLLSDFDFLPKTLFGYLFIFEKMLSNMCGFREWIRTSVLICFIWLSEDWKNICNSDIHLV